MSDTAQTWSGGGAWNRFTPSRSQHWPMSRQGAGWGGGAAARSPWGLHLLRPSDLGIGTPSFVAASLAGQPGAPGDSSDRGGGGVAGAAGQPETGRQGFSMADIVAASNAAQPHGYLDLPAQFFDPKEMAIGALASQAPLGGTGLSVLGPIAAAFMGHPRSSADVARGFASSLPTGGLMKLAEWYAGTPYAKAHPVASYYNGGNADPQGANAADQAYRAGASPGFMREVYDRTVGQKNQGGAGYAPIGQDMADTLGAAIATGTADNAFLSPGGALLNSVNADLRHGDPSGAYGAHGHQSYEGLAADMAATAQAALNDQLARGEVTQDLLDQLNAAGLTINDKGQIANEAATSDQGGGFGSGESSADLGGGATNDPGSSNWGGPDLWRGGRVPRPRPGMPDPAGPDDQFGALQSGEGVLNRAAMRKLGPALFAALNAGRFDRAALERVLMPGRG